jgi:hypothetical protein
MTPARLHSLWATVLVAVLATSASRAEVRAVALPAGFDGHYAPEGEACDGPAAVMVSEGVMIGAEFAITVTDLIEDPDPRKVEASLFNEAGGGSWTDSAVITLAEDGQGLTFAYPDGTTVVWLRCG